MADEKAETQGDGNQNVLVTLPGGKIETFPMEEWNALTNGIIEYAGEHLRSGTEVQKAAYQRFSSLVPQEARSGN